jgi:hypothetical protein
MQIQKVQVAAAEAAGARGGPGNRTPAREWYTIVVYERRRVKTVVLYVGRMTYTFNVSIDVDIGDIAVILERWFIGGKMFAYSASIHVKNLAELVRRYAPDVAEQLAHILRADGVCRGTP